MLKAGIIGDLFLFIDVPDQVYSAAMYHTLLYITML